MLRPGGELGKPQGLGVSSGWGSHPPPAQRSPAPVLGPSGGAAETRLLPWRSGPFCAGPASRRGITLVPPPTCRTPTLPGGQGLLPPHCCTHLSLGHPAPSFFAS